MYQVHLEIKKMSDTIVNVNINDIKLDKILKKLTKLEQQMSITQAQLDEVAAQLGKVFTEVTTGTETLQAAIADLEAQLAAGAALDLTAVKAAAEQLDAITPDFVPESEPVV